MRQNELRPRGKRKRKRIGRGLGSGHGTTATRGSKGQKARSGGKIHPAFEGGQNPLVKSLPQKRGFTNIFKTEYAIVNVGQLVKGEGEAEVTPERLREVGLVSSKKPVKVLGQGEVKRALVVKAHKFSGEARRKIEAAGGRAEEI